MDKELFGDLLQSLREARAIADGSLQPSRRTTIASPDVRVLRERMGLTQSEFARLLQVSIRTLQNWEQQRRTPTGPAAALLKIVTAAPDVALQTLHAR